MSDKPPRLVENRTRPEVASFNYWDEKSKFARQALLVATERRSLSHQHNPDQLKLKEHNGTA